MAIRFVKSETLTLTLELATEFKNMKPLRGERKRKESRCKFFRAHLAQGTFGTPIWKQCTIGENLFQNEATMYRGDGQHTSWVLSELAEADFPKGLSVVVMTYALDTIEDTAAFFDMFDNPVSARSQEDRTGYYSSKYPVLDGISAAFLSKTTRIISGYRKEMNDSANDEGDWLRVFPPRERGMYFAEPVNCDFAVWLYQFHDALNSWILSLDTDLLGALLFQWTKSPEDATSLWSDVFSNTSADLTSVSVELREILREMRKTPSQKKRLAKVRRAIDRLWDAYVASGYAYARPVPLAMPPANQPSL